MPSRFISVYEEHAMGSGVFVIIHSLLVAFVGRKTTQQLFLDMIRILFRAPMSFSDTTPTRRLLSWVKWSLLQISCLTDNPWIYSVKYFVEHCIGLDLQWKKSLCFCSNGPFFRVFASYFRFISKVNLFHF